MYTIYFLNNLQLDMHAAVGVLYHTEDQEDREHFNSVRHFLLYL